MEGQRPRDGEAETQGWRGSDPGLEGKRPRDGGLCPGWSKKRRSGKGMVLSLGSILSSS